MHISRFLAGLTHDERDAPSASARNDPVLISRCPFALAGAPQQGCEHPNFKPASLTGDRLSGDAAQLLVDFIQRPVIRQQLQPLGVGTILGKKRKKKPLLDEDGNPTLTAKKKKPVLISEDTGRRVKTRLSAQQTEYMQERFAEKPRWSHARVC